MIKFIIETVDNELANEIWTLKTEDIIFDYPFTKGEGSLLQTITIYVTLAASLITFARGLFELIKSKEKKSQKKTKTIIHTKKGQVEMELKKLVATYEESISIEIQEED